MPAPPAAPVPPKAPQPQPKPPALTLARLRDPQRLSLAEQVARDLAGRMLGGELRPGDRLPTERALMARYGVSRTVVREAMSSLRAGGHLATQQGRGAFMLAPEPAPIHYQLLPAEAGTAEDALRRLEIRIALESEAAALAARKRDGAGLRILAGLAEAFLAAADDPAQSAAQDQAFHLCIASLSGNAYFGTLLAGLAPHLLPRARLDLFKQDHAARQAYQRVLQGEHAQILAAIGRGDAEGARAAMRLHLTHSRERLRAALDSLPPG